MADRRSLPNGDIRTLPNGDVRILPAVDHPHAVALATLRLGQQRAGTTTIGQQHATPARIGQQRTSTTTIGQQHATPARIGQQTQQPLKL